MVANNVDDVVHCNIYSRYHIDNHIPNDQARYFIEPILRQLTAAPRWCYSLLPLSMSFTISIYWPESVCVYVCVLFSWIPSSLHHFIEMRQNLKTVRCLSFCMQHSMKYCRHKTCRTDAWAYTHTHNRTMTESKECMPKISLTKTETTAVKINECIFLWKLFHKTLKLLNALSKYDAFLCAISCLW